MDRALEVQAEALTAREGAMEGVGRSLSTLTAGLTRSPFTLKPLQLRSAT